MTLAALLGGCLDNPDSLEPTDDPGLAADDDPGDGAVPPEGGVGHAIIDGPMGRQRVPYVVRNGLAIYDGDIVLGPVERIAAPVFGGAAHKTMGRRWTNGVVRYRFDASVNANARSNINDALAYIESMTPIDFVDIGASESGNYVEYRAQPYSDSEAAAGWSDQIGMNGGEQSITFNGQPQYDNDDSVIIHETLHAVGLWHEQSRPDRDDFVIVNNDCIDWSFWPWENQQLQYEIKGDALGLGPYDYASIMHYRTGSFCQQENERPAWCNLSVDTNNNGIPEDYCATVVKKNPLATTTQIIKPRSDLSVEDVNTLFRMYADAQGVNSADEHLGKALAVGDFDGDGYDDVAVGMPDEDYPGQANVGQVYVFRGTSARLVPWQVLGQSYVGGAIEAGDHFGAALAAGDLDGDGKDDLLVGMPGEDVNVGGVEKVDAGAAAIFYGSASGLQGSELWTQSTDGAGTPDTGDRFGAAVAIATMSGVPAAIIGAPGDRHVLPFVGTVVASGAVFLFPHDFGGALLIGNPTRVQYMSGATGDDFGAALAVGRLDDGADNDLAVGAPGRSSNAGAVYLFRGLVPVDPSPTWSSSAMASYAHTLTQTGAAANNRFGAALAIGPIRGTTTRDELAVGAPGTSSAAGAVAIYANEVSSVLGSTPLNLVQTLTQASAPSSSAEAGDEFGAALAIADFQTATSQSDLVVGAPGEDGDAGAVSFFTGGSSTLTGVATNKQGVFLGASQAAGDRFGESLGFGQLNASGEGITNDQRNANLFRRVDLAVGAPGDAPLVGFGPQGYSYDPAGAGALYTFAGNGTGLVPQLIYSQESETHD